MLGDRLLTQWGMPAEEMRRLRSMLSPTQEETVGAVRPLANRFTYFFKRRRNLEYWNVFRGPYVLRSPADLGTIKEAAQIIAAHHDCLRLQASAAPPAWEEVIVSGDRVCPFVYFNSSNTSDDKDAVTSAASDIQHFAFPGELFRVCLVRTSGKFILFFALHHLIADTFSLGIVTADFFQTLHRLMGKRPLGLPAKTTSYIDFAEGSARFWRHRAHTECDYWRSLPWQKVEPFIADLATAADANIERHTVQISHKLPLEDLKTVQKQTGRQPAEIIVAAIARAYAQWKSGSPLLLALLVHGRESFLSEVNLSRTVGWISETVPVLLEGSVGWDQLIDDCRRQLRRVSSHGKSYGILRYLPGAEYGLSELPEPQISLNLKLAPGPVEISPEIGGRDHTLTLSGIEIGSTERVFVLSGGVYYDSQRALVLAWDFNNKMLSVTSVRAFTQLCVYNVGVLVCLLSGRAGSR
jgi:hypothetical protein